MQEAHCHACQMWLNKKMMCSHVIEETPSGDARVERPYAIVKECVFACGSNTVLGIEPADVGHD
jgi:hypothetical protein